MIKVGVNGYGTIGKRVADAVALQDDMKLVGIAKMGMDYKTRIAASKGIPVFSAGDAKGFGGSGVSLAGTLEDMVKQCDIVVDCTPEGVGAQNKSLYEKAGCRAIFQGGEPHSLTSLSFNAYSNYASAIGAKFARVVSCNTTGLARTILPLQKDLGIASVRAFIVRRAADPSETRSGPINAIEPEREVPSHHGEDVRTVIPDLDIETAAAKVPTTLMHMHYVTVRFAEEGSDRDAVLEAWGRRNRIIMFSGKEGVTSTAQVMDYARDLGRPRGDLYEIAVWDDMKVEEMELSYFQAVHQEADVVPENIDAIRAMCGVETDADKSIAKTDKSLGIRAKKED